MAKMNNIVLGVKRGVFRQDDPIAEHSDKEFQSLRDSVKQRDNYSCFYCGFKAEKYQEVHHIDDNHDNNSERNLVTVCPLCHSCKHIGFAGLNEKAYLVYYPKITQVEVNAMIKTLWIGKNSGHEKIAQVCINTLEAFESLQGKTEEKLTTDPAVLSGILLEMNDEDYKNRQSKLKNFLMIPRESAYKKEISYWSKNVYNGVPAETWAKILKQS